MLTNIAIQNLKPAAKPFKTADSGGLYVLTMPNGTKAWRLDYRFFGLRKTLALGKYPEVTLAEAREGRDAARKLLARDIDPGIQKKVDRAAIATANANTFGAIVADFLEAMLIAGKSEGTIEKNRWMLEDLCAPLTFRPAAEITSAEIYAMLQKMVKRGIGYSAAETRAAISRAYRLAIINLKAPADPTYALRGSIKAPEVESYAAIVDPEQVGGLMRVIDAFEGWPTLRALLRMQAIALTRPTETRKMNLSEVDFKKRVWTVPPERAKLRRPHDVYLADKALEIIEDMRPFIRRDGDVFPSMMSGKRFLSENSMNSALRRMGYAKDDHTAHGFRSTASTLLNASRKFSSEAIEAQLAHLDQNQIRRIYNRWQYWDERVEMMRWWPDYLDSLALAKAPA